MKRIPKGPLIGMLVCAFMLFGWIILAVMLTGQRDIPDFTSTDKVVMAVFAVVEVITLVLLFVFANKVGKANRPEGQPKAQTNRSRNLELRGWSIFAVAFILTLATFMAAITLRLKLPVVLVEAAPVIFGVSCALPVVLYLANFLLCKALSKRFENQSVREFYAYILSHREDAEETAAQKLRLLKRRRALSDIYAAFFALIALSVGFFGKVVTGSGTNTLILFYTFFLFLCVVSRLRFGTPQKVYDDIKSMASKEDFPHIYSLAEKAAAALNCHGDIKIFLTDEGNAGIRNENNYYCVVLSVSYISMLSEQELYCILLHEFRHVDYQSKYSDKETRYFNWLDQGGNPHYLSNITRRMYAYGDSIYGLHYILYDYAASISIETTADLAMAEHGDAATAASALIKLKYMDLYQWEKLTYDGASIYEPEQADRHHLTHLLEKQSAAIEKRQEDWKKLIDVEILSRGASHPTLKMRLASLGVSQYDTITPEATGVYAQEQQKALDRLDLQIYESWQEHYEENRKEYYLKPKQLIEEWEAAGKPLAEEDYADIGQALRQLGRVTEADRLYQQIIEEFSGSVAVNAQFMHGCFLLHRYDEAGLDHIYTAMENNKNYIEEGLEEIGEFCCITGNREELACFREKAMELQQKQKDVYGQIGTLNKGDRLSAEQLPEGMLDRILTYIRSVGQDSIENIYLVKKTITEDFATSAFVIRFCPGTDEQIQEDVLHKIFNHLDACYSWQFSLFAYQDVAAVKVETIEGSCVFTKEGA